MRRPVADRAGPGAAARGASAAVSALILATAVLAVAGCAGGGDRDRCFPARLEDLDPPIDFSSWQLVCSIDRIRPGARDAYRERYPEILAPAPAGA